MEIAPKRCRVEKKGRGLFQDSPTDLRPEDGPTARLTRRSKSTPWDPGKMCYFRMCPRFKMATRIGRHQLLPSQGMHSPLEENTDHPSRHSSNGHLVLGTCLDGRILDSGVLRTNNLPNARRSRARPQANVSTEAMNQSVHLRTTLFPEAFCNSSLIYELSSGGGDGRRGISSRFHASLSASESLYTASL